MNHLENLKKQLVDIETQINKKFDTYLNKYGEVNFSNEFAPYIEFRNSINGHVKPYMVKGITINGLVVESIDDDKSMIIKVNGLQINDNYEYNLKSFNEINDSTGKLTLLSSWKEYFKYTKEII